MMKRILITGANSYIGVSFAAYMKQFGDAYEMETVTLRDGLWKTKDFSEYDVVFHVAGVTHQKETKENASLYYDVNEHLAVAVAEKAKREGVKQFIILSSMSVYGMTVGHITKETQPAPKSSYGKSKYNADVRLEKMSCDTFRVAILRPPMVYGKGCRGNYQVLRRFALKSPVFPDYANQRSMIYIGNLTAFVKQIIVDEAEGIFFPQDAEYVSTVELVKNIASANGKHIVITPLLNWAVKLALRLRVGVFQKVFGTLTYEKVDLVSEYGFDRAKKCTEE